MQTLVNATLVVTLLALAIHVIARKLRISVRVARTAPSDGSIMWGKLSNEACSSSRTFQGRARVAPQSARTVARSSVSRSIARPARTAIASAVWDVSDVSSRTRIGH